MIVARFGGDKTRLTGPLALYSLTEFMQSKFLGEDIMKHQLLFCSLAIAVVLAGCATTDSSPKTSSKVQEKDSLMSLLGMMGGAPRDAKTLEAQLEQARAFPLGSKENPVRVNMPKGQRDYISRLNCENGAAPKFLRDGSFGSGPFETIIDRYTLTCIGSAPAETKIYMDMYFPKHVEDQAVPGFTID